MDASWSVESFVPRRLGRALLETRGINGWPRRSGAAAGPPRRSDPGLVAGDDALADAAREVPVARGAAVGAGQRAAAIGRERERVEAPASTRRPLPPGSAATVAAPAAASSARPASAATASQAQRRGRAAAGGRRRRRGRMRRQRRERLEARARGGRGAARGKGGRERGRFLRGEVLQHFDGASPSLLRSPSPPSTSKRLGRRFLRFFIPRRAHLQSAAMSAGSLVKALRQMGGATRPAAPRRPPPRSPPPPRASSAATRSSRRRRPPRRRPAGFAEALDAARGSTPRARRSTCSAPTRPRALPTARGRGAPRPRARAAARRRRRARRGRARDRRRRRGRRRGGRAPRGGAPRGARPRACKISAGCRSFLHIPTQPSSNSIPTVFLAPAASLGC